MTAELIDELNKARDKDKTFMIFENRLIDRGYFLFEGTRKKINDRLIHETDIYHCNGLKERKIEIYYCIAKDKWEVSNIYFC